MPIEFYYSWLFAKIMPVMSSQFSVGKYVKAL